MELPADVRRRAAAIRRLVLDLAPHAAERVTTGRKGKRFAEIRENQPGDEVIERLIRASLVGPPKPKRLPELGQ